ncbi:MAG TPA: fasciclin domain-containing protein [Aeromicrobium sp.]|nr:fasciclin domain-containing protein [Aeromicrobium sp.]
MSFLSHRSRTFAGLLLAVATLAACESSSAPPEAPIESTAPPSAEIVQKLVGPGCAAYGKKYASGPGSVAALADKPVAEAIKEHPMLKRFAAAIDGELNPKVNLTEEMDAGEYTVFAPTDAAFRAKVPADWERTLAKPKSAEALTDLLMFHLAVGQRNPGDLRGQIETRGGPKLTIKTDGDRIRIADQANVVCGGLRTANATIYLIDSVLMPPATP